MPARPLRLTLLAAAASGCLQGGTPAPSPPPPKPTPAATPAPQPVAPAAAILPEVAGLTLTGGSDRLSAAEYVASGPDPPIGLDQLAGWGWAAASIRTWAAGGRRAVVLVVLADRDAGAERAFAAWASAASVAPLAAGPCPPEVSGLDQCLEAQAGARTVVVGRLGPEVFRIDALNVDATPVATRQAARLRPT